MVYNPYKMYPGEYSRMHHTVRPQMEELTLEELEIVLKEARAETIRRDLVKTEAEQAVYRNKLAGGWTAFSRFLAGAIHALSIHRMLQRHCAGSGAGYALASGFKVGEVSPSGNSWGPMALIAARKGYQSAYRARQRDKANNLPFYDSPPWERTAAEHMSFMSNKLRLEPAALGPYSGINRSVMPKEKAPAVKQEPVPQLPYKGWVY